MKPTMPRNYDLFMQSVRKEFEGLLYRAYSAGRMSGEEATSIHAERLAREHGAEAVAEAIKNYRELPF